MSYEVAFQILIRVLVLSFGCWSCMLLYRSWSGSYRAVMAGCALAACVLVPFLVPVTKASSWKAPAAIPASGFESKTPVLQSSAPVPPSVEVRPELPGVEIPTEAILLGVWAAVAALLGLRFLLGAMKAAGIARRAERAMVLGHRVRLTKECLSPMTVMPGTIVLPAELAAWSDEEARAVLEHERAHAQRGDAITVFVSSLVCAALWAVPFTWLLRRELIRAIEDAADDQVLARSVDPVTYAQTLRRASEAFRAGSAAVPTFARKPMITSRIERTLRTTANRRKIRPITSMALVAMFSVFAAGAAYGVLADDPIAPPAVAGAAQVEVVQIQTMGDKPIYWRPDGTRIAAKNAITRSHSLTPKLGDVVVWLRVKTDRMDGSLWMPSVSVKGHSFSTNSGPSFKEDGWLYSASRVATFGRQLPARGDVNANVHITDWKTLPNALTADMIAKGIGRDAKHVLSGPYEWVRWGTTPFDWSKVRRGGKAAQEAADGATRVSTYVDIFVSEAGGEYDHTSQRIEYLDPRAGIESCFTYRTEPSEGRIGYFRQWIDGKPDQIKRIWMQARKGEYPVIRNVALRPKG